MPPPRLVRFLVRRAAAALLLVFLAASAAFLLARIAPGDHLPAEMDPAQAAAERRRLGLDRPLHVQYAAWLGGLARLDLGPSLRFPGRSVSTLIAERAGNSTLIGAAALVLSSALGLGLGVFTATRRRGVLARTARGGSLLMLSTPPIVLSLALVTLASRTGWFPVGGLPERAAGLDGLRYLVLPVLALALPMAAVIERLQSRALADALTDPSILAARARGVPRARLVWRHALRLSLRPVLSVYGIIIGSLISGSFVVEYVMTWPGLGRLMYDALVYRDTNLVAGCAAAGAAFLAAGIFLSDIALASVDPRAGEAE